MAAGLTRCHLFTQVISMTKNNENRKRPSLLRLALVAVLTVSLLVSGGILLRSHLAQRKYKALADSVRQPTAEAEAAAPSEVPSDEAQSTEPPRQVLPQYADLYAQNPDFFGWLKIGDTMVDYPVMHAPGETEKYLYHDFYGNSYFGGTPYVDERCTPDSTNLLIYGHNITDGSMFRGILRYEDPEFWQAHPTIRFDTWWETGEYEIVAAFYDRIYFSNEKVFKFYNVIELPDEESYNDAIANFKAKALYDTGVTPEFGTRLITLVTCTYHTDNGRFVVVAAKK